MKNQVDVRIYLKVLISVLSQVKTRILTQRSKEHLMRRIKGHFAEHQLGQKVIESTQKLIAYLENTGGRIYRIWS